MSEEIVNQALSQFAAEKVKEAEAALAQVHEAEQKLDEVNAQIIASTEQGTVNANRSAELDIREEALSQSEQSLQSRTDAVTNEEARLAQVKVELENREREVQDREQAVANKEQAAPQATVPADLESIKSQLAQYADELKAREEAVAAEKLEVEERKQKLLEIETALNEQPEVAPETVAEQPQGE